MSAVLTALLMLPAPASVAGQSPETVPVVAQLPSSARAMGLGGAYPLGDPDSDVLFVNPAVLSDAGGLVLGLLALPGAGVGATVSAQRDWWDGAVGIGVQYVGAEDVATTTHVPGSAPRQIGELALALGYARTLLGVDVGASARWIDRRAGTERSYGALFDVGVAHEVGPLTAGLAVRDVGRALQGAGDADPPLRVTAGLGGYGRPLGPLDVGASAAVTRLVDGGWEVGGGLELGYWPIVGRTFVVRIGGVEREGKVSHALGTSGPELRPVTLGGSYWGDDLRIDYAWQPAEDGRGRHRVGLGWR